MGWLFNPYEEPPDPYGLNEHGFDRLALVMGAIPFVGAGVAITALIGQQTPLMGVRQNPFNMDNTAWNSGVVTVGLQLCYLALVVVLLT